MWVCLNNSFLSIVENKKDKTQLLVRARVRGHIEQTFPDATIIEDGGTDYKFRAFISRERVAYAMYKSVMNVDYGNFKNSVKDTTLHDAYSDFWLVMYNIQEKPYDRYRMGVPYVR